MTERSPVLRHLHLGGQTHPEAVRAEVQFPGPRAAGIPQSEQSEGQVPSSQKKVDQDRRKDSQAGIASHTLVLLRAGKSRPVYLFAPSNTCQRTELFKGRQGGSW